MRMTIKHDQEEDELGDVSEKVVKLRTGLSKFLTFSATMYHIPIIRHVWKHIKILHFLNSWFQQDYQNICNDDKLHTRLGRKIVRYLSLHHKRNSRLSRNVRNYVKLPLSLCCISCHCQYDNEIPPRCTITLKHAFSQHD